MVGLKYFSSGERILIVVPSQGLKSYTTWDIELGNHALEGINMHLSS